MPTVSAERLRAIAADLLEGAGAPRSEAETVARHCVDALTWPGTTATASSKSPHILTALKKGTSCPALRSTSCRNRARQQSSMAIGASATSRPSALWRMTIEKAKTQNVAATTIYKQGHVGRVAAYPLMAAEAGMIGIMTADSGRAPKQVAPFGGREARLGTNPISIAVPSDLDGPFFFDLSTAAAAAGKIKLAQARGETVPEGWLIGADGQPTD